ncbi:FAD-dependent monooxygenase [Streptomyces sp. NPDC049837]|uniref:FAD-dependent monooxygenase n=1 Tax=Streptomyces sp. NPDC049837 TaxID=3155277 RepID=UPI003441348E
MGSLTRAQVLVAGGGPVGMLVAAELAGQGVDVLLLESEKDTSERPRATTLHARTVQCLARRGYLPAPEPGEGGVAVTMPFHFAGIPGLSITAPAGEPNPIWKVPQADLERLFEAEARARGARILRGHRVTDVAQDAAGVRVTATGPEGCATYGGTYLVGADGARSTVRRLAGIASETWPATVSAMMGLVRFRDRDTVPPGWHRTPRGWLVVKEEPDGSAHVRTVGCPPAPADRHLPLTLEELSGEVSRIVGRDIAMADARWLSRFSDFTRLARTYREGAVFLAGDAAHVHFPVGGQGLSTGLLDALNLSWKLALAVRGGAGDTLLDTYDTERRVAARRVIDNTRAQVALMRPDLGLDPLRTLLGGMLTSDRGNDYLSGMISAQDTVLPAGSASLLEGTFLQNAVLYTPEGRSDVIGLLREGKPLLLLFGEEGNRYLDAARDWAAIVRVVHCVPTGAVPCAALLVRPDGYIAWASDGGGLADTLRAYFGEETVTGAVSSSVTGAVTGTEAVPGGDPEAVPGSC